MSASKIFHHYCASVYCNNKTKASTYSFFKFPKDPERFKAWAMACGREDLVHKKKVKQHGNYVLCGAHFEEQMFRNSQKNRLRPDAIPILCSTGDVLRSETSTAEEISENTKLKDDTVSDTYEVIPIDRSQEVSSFIVLGNENCFNETSLDQLSTTCRLCFTSLEDGRFYQPTDEASSNCNSNIHVTKIEEMIAFVLPELDIKLYPNPGICEKCVELLCYSVELKETWLRAEERIQRLVKYGEEENKYYLCIDNNLMETNSSDVHGNENSFHAGEDTKVSLIEDESVGIKKKPDQLDTWGPGPYICHLCAKTYIDLKPFKVHLHRHRFDSMRYICKLCNSVHDNFMELNKHRRTHGHVCRSCGKVSKTSVEHNSHRRIHTRNPCVCEVCGKLFPSRVNLRQHKANSHERKRKFQCDVCGTILQSQSTLKAHVDSHDVLKKKYKCSLCDRNFLYESRLRRHVVMAHEESKQCEICGRKLKHKINLQKHMTVYHSEKWKYTCKLCSQRFVWVGRLYIHMEKVHGKILENLSE